MKIKNETVIKQADVKGAMRASHFDNQKYKLFKIIYNSFGLLFGMLFIRLLIPVLLGKSNEDIGFLIMYAAACLVLLYIGMYGMDRNYDKQFEKTYAKLVGRTFQYEIDSEELAVISQERTDTVLWSEVDKWSEDAENFYVFCGDVQGLILCKEGFTECSAKDFRQLASAVMQMRAQKDGTEKEKKEREQTVTHPEEEEGEHVKTTGESGDYTDL